MATDNRVKEIMSEELAQRANQQYANAGESWPKQDLGFFFPGNEDTVDLCVLAVLDRALSEDQTTVPQQARENVASLIKTSTLVKNAIKTIALTTLQPTPQ